MRIEVIIEDEELGRKITKKIIQTLLNEGEYGIFLDERGGTVTIKQSRGEARELKDVF